jgi:hypothetical protein
VRTHGDWEGWIRFYLVGVEAVARQATRTTQALLALFRDDERLEGLGIAKEITGRARGRLYAYERQLEILNRGVGEGVAPTETGPPPLRGTP